MSYHTGIMRSQVHQKSQDSSRGTQLSSIQNTSVGWKFAGQNLQEAKAIGRIFELPEKILG
jgi:hypothetical protein